MDVERGMEQSEEGEGEAALQMTLEQCELCLMFSSYRLSDTNILSGLNRIGPLLSTAIHHLWSELVASDKTTNCTWYQKKKKKTGRGLWCKSKGRADRDLDWPKAMQGYEEINFSLQNSPKMTPTIQKIEFKDPNRLSGRSRDQTFSVIRRDVHSWNPWNPPTIRQLLSVCCHNSLAPSNIHLTSLQERDLTTAQREETEKNDGCRYEAAHPFWIKRRMTMTTQDADQWHGFIPITSNTTW